MANPNPNPNPNQVPDGKIGPEATRRLADALRDNVVVLSLLLGDNALGEQGAAHLAAALEAARRVQTAWAWA